MNTYHHLPFTRRLTKLAVSGIVLPRGLARNQRLPVALVTPSTKETDGHDRPISGPEILSSGLVEPALWREVEVAALALFHRGQELALRRGLILADTKYEFGLADGALVLADELHSPDSSRFWWANSYERLFSAGEDQNELDKEPFRRWLAERGFAGEGEAPAIPDSVRVETGWRYIQAYEAISGEKFAGMSADPQSEQAFLGRIIAERL